MRQTAVTPSPGFISIAVSDVSRSAAFYERHLGGVRDTFDFGPDAVAFVGWPRLRLQRIFRGAYAARVLNESARLVPADEPSAEARRRRALPKGVL